jgi:O-antigen chain-terminating methyltransferase
MAAARCGVRQVSGNFYRAFEDRHRGTRELISKRLMVYLPFIMPLLEGDNSRRAADLGCGRGEWLEILIGCGFDANGIDLDEGMLEACRERGLPAQQNDALSYLATLEDSSLAIVSGFHIAEHIPFPDLQILVAEALRVLIPGGVLILETPNAENIAVGTNGFYLDPTHERPIPHLLLSFLTDHTGFSRSKLLRLQEPDQLKDPDHPVDLLAVLSAVSPDYAIVAQKKAAPEKLQAFDEVFGKRYGLALDEIAQRYDHARQTSIEELQTQSQAQAQHGAWLESLIGQVSDRALELEDRAHKLDVLTERLNGQVHEQLREMNGQLHEAKLQLVRVEAQSKEAELTARLEQHRAQADASYSAVEARSKEVEARASELQRQLDESLGNAHLWYTRAIACEAQQRAMLTSTSWRLTAPLRFCSRAATSLLKSPRHTIKWFIRGVAARAVRFVLARPRLSSKLNRGLKKFPRLHARLSNMARNRAASQPYAPGVTPMSGFNGSMQGESVSGLQRQTQRANSIYQALESAANSKVEK